MEHDRRMRVAVYCSAADRLPAQVTAGARTLGLWIGRHGAELVYGGVDAGLMRTVAQAVAEIPGHAPITGVVPRLRQAMASPLNDNMIAATGLADRKDTMQRMADVFVALPGGYGTLDEIMSTVAHLSFNRITGKKVLILNHDGLYDGLQDLWQDMTAKGLMKPEAVGCVEFLTDIADLTGRLEKIETTYYDKK